MSVSVDGNPTLCCELCGGEVPVNLGIGIEVLGSIECPHCFTVHIIDCELWSDEDSCDVHQDYYLVMGEPA